jgi:hypothetical protein
MLVVWALRLAAENSKNRGNARIKILNIPVRQASFISRFSYILEVNSQGAAAENSHFVRGAAARSSKMLRDAWTSGLVKLRCSAEHVGERQVWAEVGR